VLPSREDAPTVIRLVLVDDEPMVCAHLTTILEQADDITVVGTAHDGAEAVEVVTGTRPDLVLMDLRMPGVDGLTAIERIAQADDAPPVVALTTFDADEYVLQALQLGAAGFLIKSTPPQDLVGLVRVASEGHTVLSPEAAKRLVSASTGQRDRSAKAQERLADLTEREIEVLRCLGQGMSNADIAGSLFLSEATVKSYVSRMLVKLECSNRTQAGLLAVEAGV
jgi:DNA-binding NarL/FixJ family response regulator